MIRNQQRSGLCAILERLAAALRADNRRHADNRHHAPAVPLVGRLGA
jgi:hypothetical protein